MLDRVRALGDTGAVSDHAIRCRGVLKRFGRVTALDGLDLDVPTGLVVGFLGPNGAGKSTTIRILLDLARADGGTIEVLGGEPRRAGAELRGRIGYVPGELRLDDRLTVAETFRSWERLRGGRVGEGRVDGRYLDELCERVDLDPSRRTKGLSSGNRRKVGLVGAFMARPELLILDEPTSGLDPLVQAEFVRLVHETQDDGRTVFLSSHVLSEVQHVADRVVVIRNGRSVADGAVDDLRRVTRQPFTVWFTEEVPAERLAAIPNVSDLRVTGREVSGFVDGSPTDLLAELGRHRVDHVLMEEPDLEQAFLRLYGDEDAA